MFIKYTTKNYDLRRKNQIEKRYFFFFFFQNKKKNIFLKKYFIKNGISFTFSIFFSKNLAKIQNHVYNIKKLNVLIFNQIKKKKEIIFRLKNTKCYKGIRFLKNLPVNGQRTKTNSKTRKKYKII